MSCLTISATMNLYMRNCREEILTLKIALNETGSAGLGISLKARAVMKPDGTRHDCGIFIKKVN